MNIKSIFLAALAFTGSCLVAVSSFAAQEPTAFQLVKEGNHYIGEPSRDKVLEISSEKSIASLTPSLWTVEYFDPDARSKVVEVKFGSGLKLDVNRPWKVFGGGKETKIIDFKKMKVDSDEAIKIATTLQLLSPFSLKNTQLRLFYCDDGLVWRVRLWAAKLGKPEAVTEIGDVFISPADGKIVRADLHIERLN